MDAVDLEAFLYASFLLKNCVAHCKYLSTPFCISLNRGVYNKNSLSRIQGIIHQLRNETGPQPASPAEDEVHFKGVLRGFAEDKGATEYH